MAGKYAVLKPLAPGEGKRPTRDQIELYTVNDIPFVPVGDARLVAIDFETRGTAHYPKKKSTPLVHVNPL